MLRNTKSNYSVIRKADRMNFVQIDLLCINQRHKDIYDYMVEEINIALQFVFNCFKGFDSELYIP